ncbi:MAG: hypothetical protein SXV54_06590 [Chloroflexota bacterium]|nr:hypothetical protein [Chloroflexota bacterium]
METANPFITITLDALRLLFQSPRRWWYHRRLRERGEVAKPTCGAGAPPVSILQLASE